MTVIPLMLFQLFDFKFKNVSPLEPGYLQIIPASFILEPGQSRGVLLRAVSPDLMYGQQYPLEAVVQFLAQGVSGDGGTGAWRSGGAAAGASSHGGGGGAAGSPAMLCISVS